MTVASRFTTFLGAIRLTESQVADGKACRKSVVRALNEHYWSLPDGNENSIFIGAWGKRTRLNPPRDVDVLFWLPEEIAARHDARPGNRQAGVLHEVRNVLRGAFPRAEVMGDGPAVLVPLPECNVELIPAYRLPSGLYRICMADQGGRYKDAAYDAEAQDILSSNLRTSGKTRDLIQMIKRWQAHCDVPLKSFWIELIVVQFLEAWRHRIDSVDRYDLMIRDFFEDLGARANTTLSAPGTGEQMFIGSDWLPAAQSAHRTASTACVKELNDPAGAGEEWRKIFGPDVPREV